MGSGGLGAGWGRALAARRWDACFSLVFLLAFCVGHLGGLSVGRSVLGVGKGGVVGWEAGGIHEGLDK